MEPSLNFTSWELRLLFVLFVRLLQGAGNAVAQTPSWGLRNIMGAIETPSGYYAFQTVAINATTAWHLMAPNGADLGLESATHVARTTDGQHWSYLPITGTPGYGALSLTAVDANTAYVARVHTGPGSSAGGEILRTTDGGWSWTKVTTTEFTSTGSFLFWVHFFDATNGLAFGAPVNGSCEVYRTTDAAATWQRVPADNLPALLPGEGSAWYYFALGNTVWVGNGIFRGGVRVFKSTDRGLTWSASAPTGLNSYAASLAFKDSENGLAISGLALDGSQALVRTTDGGATWTRITPAANALGRFYAGKLDAIPGAFLSVGVNNKVWGSSVSVDGITWTDIEPGRSNYPRLFSVDAVSATVAFAATSTESTGAGGFYQLSGSLLAGVVTTASSRRAAPGLTAYPNPSATGVFQLQLSATPGPGSQLRVLHVVGREVARHQLPFSPAGLQTSVDLSREAVGAYVLELRTGAGSQRVRVWSK